MLTGVATGSRSVQHAAWHHQHPAISSPRKQRSHHNESHDIAGAPAGPATPMRSHVLLTATLSTRGVSEGVTGRSGTNLGSRCAAASSALIPPCRDCLRRWHESALVTVKVEEDDQGSKRLMQAAIAADERRSKLHTCARPSPRAESPVESRPDRQNTKTHEDADAHAHQTIDVQHRYLYV